MIEPIGIITVDRPCDDLGGLDVTGDSYLIRDDNGTVLGELTNQFGGTNAGNACLFSFHAQGEKIPRRDHYIIDDGRGGETRVTPTRSDLSTKDGDLYELFDSTLG